MTFVIVDDEESMIERVKNIINKVMFDTNKDYKILTFNGFTDNLKKVIETDELKTYILDIELNNVSGLDIGKYIRDCDWDSELIYMTNHDKMFERIFRSIYKVFDFIEKFDSLDKRLEFDIRKIFLHKKDKKKFIYQNSRVNFEIYLDDIYYIYRDTIERKLVIVNKHNNTFLINMNINEILDYLDKRFKRVHKSCIVNKDKVNLYNYARGYFILDNNTKVDMLSKRYKDV